MKSILSAGFFILILLLPAWQWAMGVVNPLDIFEHQLPPGQWFYLVSKLVAQYAFLVLTLQLILGFFLTNQTISLSWLTVNVHRTVGIGVFVTSLTHAGLFIVAAWLRSGHFPLEVVSLQFTKGYYAFYVSVGVLTVCFLCVVFLIGLFRKQLPNSIFRCGHKLAWIVWILGICHSFAIGTEIYNGMVWSWYYLLVTILISLLIFYRIYLALLNRESLNNSKAQQLIATEE